MSAIKKSASRPTLDGITLEMIVTQLSERMGWEAMAAAVPVRCFTHDPSIKSSLKFLRRTPWARKKVEELYLQQAQAVFKSDSAHTSTLNIIEQSSVRAIPSLADAYARLERADELLSEVHVLAQEICTAQAEATRVHVAPGKILMPGEFGQLFSVDSANTPIAARLSVLVGDSINSLRSCLDYLIGELAELDSGSRKRRTQFPVEQSSDVFRGRRQTFLNGVSDAHVAHIETLQPYSGTSWTAKLARMSNWDKHNKLVLVAHDYILSGTVSKGEASDTGEVPLQFQIALQPSLRVQLEDGLQLLETLDEVRVGVASTLDHFSLEFVTA